MGLEDLLNSIPNNLRGHSVFLKLETLVTKYLENLNTNNVEQFSINEETLPVNTKIGISIMEFIDLVSYTNNLDEKKYFLNRLISMKSTEIILDELEKYLNIEFDRTLDENNIPKTFYSPKILKVTIESLTIQNININFEKIIKTMFDNLLYFVNYEMTLKNLILELELQIKTSIVISEIIPVKYTHINSNYYYYNKI